jgi:hypothetical protein
VVGGEHDISATAVKSAAIWEPEEQGTIGFSLCFEACFTIATLTFNKRAMVIESLLL